MTGQEHQQKKITNSEVSARPPKLREGCAAPPKNPGLLVLKTYYVYIMASLSRTLYIGVTNHPLSERAKVNLA